MFFIYILYDSGRDKFYVGQTSDLEKRLKQHQNKESFYTKSGNWELVYSEEYSTRKKAMSRETKIKKMKSKKWIKKLELYQLVIRAK